jgi:hypothetical protein
MQTDHLSAFQILQAVPGKQTRGELTLSSMVAGQPNSLSGLKKIPLYRRVIN